MRVIVHLHTTLQRESPQGPLRRLELSLAEGATLAEVLRQLAIVPWGDAILLVVNGRQVETSQVLADGDEIHLIPALSGGRCS